MPSSPQERALLFAQCAGTLAAEAEHMRLAGDAALGEIEARYELFSMMLDATLTDEMRHGGTAIRIRSELVEARAMQRQLLMSAHYAVHHAREPARHAAARRMSLCESLLLGG